MSVQSVLDWVFGFGLRIFMPRVLRLDAPGVLRHVIGWGIKKRIIFFNENDDDFIEHLAAIGVKPAVMPIHKMLSTIKSQGCQAG